MIFISSYFYKYPVLAAAPDNPHYNYPSLLMKISYTFSSFFIYVSILLTFHITTPLLKTSILLYKVLNPPHGYSIFYMHLYFSLILFQYSFRSRPPFLWTTVYCLSLLSFFYFYLKSPVLAAAPDIKNVILPFSYMTITYFPVY